ncbi:MAG: CHASE2 domain-containing protein [Verrucomicrobia bacterium]|nr:CHASE2 domain-containing protein [Verrucomicrobiota bacterium]
MPRSASWLLVVLLLASLFLLRESRQPTSPVAALDERFLDWLMANTGSPLNQPRRGPLPTVTLVEIGDDALDPSAGKEALSALDYALFLQAANAFDPAVVAVLPVLEFPRPQPEYERILLNQALRTSKLLLAVQPNGPTPARPPVNAPPAITPEAIVAPLRHVQGDTNALPELRELDRRPAERLLLTAAACGPTSTQALDRASPAAAALVRTVPLLFRTSTGDVLPAFTLQAAMLWLQLTPDEIRVELPRYIQLGNRLRVPVDAAGALRLDVRPFGRQLSRIDLDDLLLASNEKNGEAPTPAANASPASAVAPDAGALKAIAGGTLLLGRTDRQSRTLALPTGDRVTPAELQALAMVDLQTHAFIQRAPLGYDALVIAALLVFGWSLVPLRRSLGLALVFALLLVYTLIALMIFDFGRLWLPWAMPTGALAVLAVLIAVLPHPAADHAAAASEAAARQ